MTRHSVRRLASDLSVQERLFARRQIQADGCWLYVAALGADGYGTITIGGRAEGVHRVAYREFVGEIPSRFTIDHLCRNRACFNPDHLEAVTHSENCRRREAARSAA